jgi:hypothetical protein
MVLKNSYYLVYGIAITHNSGVCDDVRQTYCAASCIKILHIQLNLVSREW